MTEIIRDISGKIVMTIYTDKYGRHFYDHNGSKIYLPLCLNANKQT